MFLWKSKMEIFNCFINNNGLEKNKEIEELYKKIKDEYQSKINDKLIDIKAEKIRLDNIIGKYYGINENLYISITLSIIASVIVTIYFKGLLQYIISLFPKQYELYLNFAFTIVVIMIVGIYSSIGLLISLKRRTVYNISLKVIEDIEKEKESNKNKRNIKVRKIALYVLKKEVKNLNNSLNNIFNINKEIAVTKSNEVDLINKKVDDLKKFYGI